MRRFWIPGALLVLCVSPLAAQTDLVLSGLLVGEDGDALPGARVSASSYEPVTDRLERELQGGTRDATAATLSDREGRFRLSIPSAGLWQLRVEAKGFLPREATIEPLTDSRELGTIELQAATRLTVRTLDTDGTPLAGVTVLVESDRSRRFRGFGLSWAHPARIAISDREGNARFERGERERVRLVGFRADRSWVERRGALGSGATLRLPSGTARDVRIVQADGAPAAGARIELDGDPIVLGRADGEGRARLTPRSKGTEVVVTVDGLVLWSGSVVPAGEEPARPFEIRLLETRTMVGRVIDAKTRDALAGAVVWDRSDPRIATVSDRSGQFALRGPASHRLEIAAGAVGYLRPEPFEFPLNGDGRPGPTIALDPAATVTGRVIDANAAGIPGATVSMSEKQTGGMIRMRIGMPRAVPDAVTDEHGRFRITAIDPDLDYDVKATAEGYAPAEQAVADLQPHGTVSGITLKLDAGRAIRGSIVNRDGDAIGGVELTATTAVPNRAFAGAAMRFGDDQPNSAESTSDDEGRFAVQGLPSGKFDLTARRSGFAPHTIAAIEIEGEDDVDVGEITLLPGETIEGLVLDSDGAPVEGAEVMVSEASPMSGLMLGMPFGEPGNADGVADPGGWFAISDLSAEKRYTVTANRPGFVNAQVDGVTVPRSEPLELRLDPSSRLVGTVVDSSGDPIAGARVNMMRKRSIEAGGMAMQVAFGEDTTTDVEGRFAFEEQEPGKATLTTSASGYQESVLADVVIPKGEDLDDVIVELEEGAILQGRVLTPDGRPAIGASVGKVSAGRSFGPRMGGDAPVDGDGYYRLEGLAPGELSVQAQHPEYPRVARDVELETGINALNLDFEGGQDVTGRVVDGAGKPVPAAGIQAIPVGQFWGQSEARSEADGSFTLRGVQDGEYTLRVEAEGYASSRDEKLNVSGQPVAGVEIVLDPGARIVGTVSGLDPLDYDRVSIHSTSASFDFNGSGVDHEGRFRLDHVAPGEHTVSGTLTDSARRANATVRVEPGVDEIPVELVFDRGLTLSGTVHQAGAPIAGATISAANTSEDRLGWSQTDANGSFAIDGLVPGSYDLTVREFRSGLAHSESVEVAASREIEIEIPSAAVRGTVIDATDRQPLAGVHLRLTATGQTPRGFMPLHAATTDAEGKFELPGIADGSWELSAQKQGYAASKQAIQVQHERGEDSVRVSLDPTEGINLEVRMPSGNPPDEVRLALLSGDAALVNGTYSTGENGSVRVSTVPPGEWDLLVSAPGSAAGSYRIRVPGPKVLVELPPATRLDLEIPALFDSDAYASVRLKGSDGQAYRGVGWSGQPQSSWQMRGGRLSLATLPPGNWTVEVEARDGQTWRGSTTTQPGSAASLVLEAGR